MLTSKAKELDNLNQSNYAICRKKMEDMLYMKDLASSIEDEGVKYINIL